MDSPSSPYSPSPTLRLVRARRRPHHGLDRRARAKSNSIFIAPTTGAVATSRCHPFFSQRSHSHVPTARLWRTPRLIVSASASPASSLEALIFDCDGVILESDTSTGRPTTTRSHTSGCAARWPPLTRCTGTRPSTTNYRTASAAGSPRCSLDAQPGQARRCWLLQPGGQQPCRTRDSSRFNLI